MTLFSILFRVDTKVVLYLLHSTDSEVRFDIIFVIKYLIHCLLVKSTGVTFCWISSTCGLTFIECADRTAE